jgi:hypothetical protein
MLDDYLLLTPALALGVLALVRFVGCNLLFVAEPDPFDADPPANFRAQPGNHRIDLFWDPVDGADSYQISRAEAPGPPYAAIFNVDSAATTFGDSPLTNGVTEFYVIAASKGGETSTKSSPEVSATPGQGLTIAKTLGTIRNDFSGFAGMVIQIGAVPLIVVGIGRIVVAGNGGTHILKIADGLTGVDVPGGTVTIDLAAGGIANEFTYGILPAPITLAPNKEFLVLSQETLGGDQFFDLDTTVLTGPEASVVSAVFGDGVTPFVRGGGPGHSYGPVDVLF